LAARAWARWVEAVRAGSGEVRNAVRRASIWAGFSWADWMSAAMAGWRVAILESF
jgi:hypothetical protein